MRSLEVAFGREQALLTDLYELTMAQSYLAQDRNRTAVFELFYRSLPPSRNYLISCGVTDVLEYLENWRFDESAVNYLASLGQFSASFLDQLTGLRFTGDVFAVPDGSVVFAGEPVLQVIAPIVEAQLIESFVLNLMHYQTLVASKAARVVSAAAGRSVIDFGMRRTHGAHAAMMAAKAGYVAGLEGTSNVLAGRTFGIPVAGTMAHSYVQCHDLEEEAFKDFARLYPDTTLVVDTYDTLEGVRKVIDLSLELGDQFEVRAVRLDSGELLELSREVRRLLDDSGLQRIGVFASGNLDEYRISELLAAGAPIDGFGVGTRLGTSQDAPSLDSAYKLVEYDGEGRIKLSRDKITLPCRKQVFRLQEGPTPIRDLVGRWDEDLPGEPLLEPMMHGGRSLRSDPRRIDEARQRALEQVEALPVALRGLDRADPPYPVVFSEQLVAELERASERHSLTP